MAEPERRKILWVIPEDLMKARARVRYAIAIRVAVNVNKGDLGTPSDHFGDVIKYFLTIFFDYIGSRNLFNAG
jgi:hypothetical protein